LIIYKSRFPNESNNELINQLNIEKQSILSQHSNEIELLNNKSKSLSNEIAIANENCSRYREEVLLLKSNINTHKNKEIDYLNEIKKFLHIHK
jgi:hypothetical protein